MSLQARNVARIVRVAIALGLTIGMGVAQAQTPPPYPVKAVTVVVPEAAGTPADALARLTAQRLSERLQQPFNVENRPSNDLVQAALDVLKAPADGYTLLFATSRALGIGPALTNPAPFNAVYDFTPVSLVATVDYLLVATPSLGLKDAKAAVTAMKSKPGTMRYASPGKADPAHLLMLTFASRAGVKLQEVAFKDAKEAQAGLLAGKADFMFVDAAAALPLAEQGRIAILGTAAGRPLPFKPEILPLAGVAPLLDLRLWQGLVARTGTPKTIVMTLSVEMREIEATESFREALRNLAMESVPAQKPEHFGAIIQSHRTAWADLVKQAGAAAP